MKPTTQPKANVPALRFPEFEGEWENLEMGQLAEITTGNKDTQNKIEEGKFPFFVRSQTVERINTFSFDGEAILTSGDGVGVGKNFHYINGKFDFHQRVYCLRNFKKLVSGKYLFFYFSEKFNARIMRMSAKNSVDSIRRNMIFDMPVDFPSLPEQQKIASFLTAVDEKLQGLKKKKSLLEQYKKGVMQKLFSQELRFKDEHGNDFPEWEEKQLGEISKLIKRKIESEADINDLDVLTISAGRGFISQKERFNQVIAGDSLTKYTLLKKGELAYNKGASKRFQFGCIYSLKTYNSALVPNVYISFGLNKGFDSEFYNQLFSTGYADKELRKFISSSVRLDGLLNINKEDFFSMIVPAPSLNEQTKISKFLTSIDKKTDQCQQQIDGTELYKKGLLQQMFV